jgi:phosphatidylglycerophosphatase C
MNNPTLPELRLAIFDFDGTLCRVNSYHVFLKWLMKRPTPIALKVMGVTALRRLKLISRPFLMKIALESLKGKTREEVELIGRSIFEETILPNAHKTALTEMKKKRDAGYTVLILSGAFDFILKPFCDFYEIDHWHSTQILYSNELCTGGIDGIEFLGTAKRDYLVEYFSESNVNWGESCAYSDELTDLPLFSLVGSKFFVLNGSQRDMLLPEDIQCASW